MPDSKSVKRTKIAIENALFDLLRTKNFDDITLSEIIEESDYSRSTFYKHYSDKYDFASKLLSDGIDRFVAAIHTSVKRNAPADSRESAQKMLYGIYSYVEQNRELFNIIIEEKIPNCSIIVAADLLYKSLRNSIKLSKKDLDDDLETDYFFYMTAYEIMGSINFWLTNSFVKSTYDITNLSLASYETQGFLSIDVK